MHNSSVNPSSSDDEIEPGVDFIPAPLPARILAYILDLLASVVITLSLHRFVGGFLLNIFGHDSLFGLTLATSFWFIGSLGYWVVVPATTGATPGKMLFHLRIVSNNTKPLNFSQIILREVIGHAANVVTLGLGFLSATQNNEQRGLNDRIAGTRLIQFTSAHPELYKVQDLCIREDGKIAAYEEQLIGVTGSVTESEAPQQTTQDEIELRKRVALGPSLEELAATLRRTAVLVSEGQLMPKVLDRKREDFIEQIGRVDLGEKPEKVIETIVALGKEGLLTRENLEKALDVLRNRLAR